MFLESELTETENLIKYSNKLETKVSLKGVGWHIDHLLKVLVSVSESLKKSNPETYKWEFNFLRTIIFTIQTIPIGKGKAPKSVVAVGEINEEDIYDQLKKAKQLLLEIDNISSNSYFNHPYFGLLNLRLSKQFLRIHTRHHLKIIRKIIT